MNKTDRKKWHWFNEELVRLAEVLIKEHSNMPMTFSILDDQGNYHTYMMDHKDTQEKMRCYRVVSGLMGILNSNALCVMSEVWISKQDADEERKYSEPRLDPNRTEGFIKFVRMNDKRRIEFYDIEKDRTIKRNRTADGAEISTPNFDNIFANIPKDMPFIPHDRRQKFVNKLMEMADMKMQRLDEE